MKRILLYTILILITLTGCRDDRFGELDPNDSSRISFGVTISEGYPQSQIKTRGTPQVGTSAYESEKIKLIAVYRTQVEILESFTALLKKGDTEWSLNPVRYFDGRTYNFCAVGSDLDEITISVNENGLVIDEYSDDAKIFYEVPTDVTKQPDLLIGDMVKGQSKGKVPTMMHHALSCIGFVATTQQENSRKVKSVTVKNVYSKGYTSLAKESGTPISWATEGDPNGVNLSASLNDESLESTLNDLTRLMSGNGYLMMMPQTLPEGAQVEVKIWDGASDQSINTITYNIPPTTWEPGKKYIYYFDEPRFNGTATYYERYTDGTLGLYFYTYQDDGVTPIKLETTLSDVKPIADAGYGLLVPASVYTQHPSIYLGLGTENDDYPKDKSISDGSIAAVLRNSASYEFDCVLYPLSQNLYPYDRAKNPSFDKRQGFMPYITDKAVRIKAGVSSTGSGKPIETRGYILPHYAKGVYTENSSTITDYLIRTPIQMRNISYQAATFETGVTKGKTYKIDKTNGQETLDFAIYNDRSVYGNDVTSASFFKESIVIGSFNGTFAGAESGGVITISGLIINAPLEHRHNTALFEKVEYEGTVENLTTAPSCIYINNSIHSNLYFAGIVAQNEGTVSNVINNASLTNKSNTNLNIAGIAGLNTHRIKKCKNFGAINNNSNNSSSRTGGIVAWNERYMSWHEIDKQEKKDAFSFLGRNDFTSAMVDTHPGAVISECTNDATIIGAGTIGGIAGYNNFGGVVYKCTNNGAIRNNGKQTSNIMLGGIVGLQQCGEKNNSTTNPSKNDPPQFFSVIQDCQNKGNVTATSGILGSTNLAVGGIIGFNDFSAPVEENDTPTGVGYEIESYGKVSQCVVSNNAVISGYFSDTGGICGLNSGSVSRSRCDQVSIRGVFGNGAGRNSAGGIVGTNNYYVGNCLFTNSSTTSSPISNAPVFDGVTSAGGIVGVNNTYAADLKSPSGYIHRCIFAAIAPKVNFTGSEIGTFAPIAGWSGGYLFRKWDGTTHIKDDGVDATSGATPIYTLDDNYYASGTNVNYVEGNTSFANEPASEKEKIGPFDQGRYPYGQVRMSNGEKDLLPLSGWYTSNGNQNWIANSRPPINTNWYNASYTLPEATTTPGAKYILGALVQAIKDKNYFGSDGKVSLSLSGLQIANTARISLNYMSSSELIYIKEINIDLAGANFLSNRSGGTGTVFFRAPAEWKFDASQNPKPYKMTITSKDKNGNTTTSTYYYCLVTATTGTTIKMVPQ